MAVTSPGRGRRARRTRRARSRGAGRGSGCARARPASRGGSRTCTSRPRSLFYLLFAFGPLLYTTWLSFFDWDGLTVGEWVGLDNYSEVLSDEAIRASFVHSFDADLLLRDPAGAPRPRCSRR